MFLKPKKDLRVPDPIRRDMLPEEGREVEASPYWSRRLRDKDVETITVKPTKNAGKGD